MARNKQVLSLTNPNLPLGSLPTKQWMNYLNNLTLPTPIIHPLPRVLVIHSQNALHLINFLNKNPTNCTCRVTEKGDI